MNTWLKRCVFNQECTLTFFAHSSGATEVESVVAQAKQL